MKTKSLLFGAFLALSLFIACDSSEKVQDTTAVNGEEITVDSDIDGSIDDVANIADDQYQMQQGATSKTTGEIRSILPLCAKVTTALENGTYTKTIDFGTEGCALPNGNVLKGKITISFSSNFNTLTRSITCVFVGFSHNNKHIEGTRSIMQELKSTDLLATLHPVSTQIVDMTITVDGKVYNRTGTRVREMIEGFGTPYNWEDNAFLVTGHHTTKFPNGNEITSTIKTPLSFVMSCKLPFPVKGSVTIVKNDKEGLLDYGNGECDDLATITIAGVSKEIHLKK